jgi:hypothetical protein
MVLINLGSKRVTVTLGLGVSVQLHGNPADRLFLENFDRSFGLP